MKLPARFYKGLVLFLLAVIVVCVLSPLVLDSQIQTDTNFSDVLAKGPSDNKGTPIFIKGLFAFLAAFVTLKGYKNYMANNYNLKNVKKFRDIIGHISSLEEKVADPGEIKPKRQGKKRYKKNKTARLSRRHAKKIIKSSAALGKIFNE